MDLIDDNPLNCAYGNGLWDGTVSGHFFRSHGEIGPIPHLMVAAKSYSVLGIPKSF